MSIQISSDIPSGRPTVTFILPDDGSDTTVSVVGSFNDWTPGVDVLSQRDDGVLAAEATVEGDEDIHFRYLRTGGIWFDDDEADDITQFGSVIRAERLSATNGIAQPLPDE